MDDDGFDPSVGNHDLTSVLEHNNRIRQISLICRSLTTLQIEKVWAAMQLLFPELTTLTLDLQYSPSETVTILEIAKTTFICHLPRRTFLYGVPHSAYISPEMVTCLPVDQPRRSFPWIRISSILS
jgi:hypothetical protein